MNAEPLVSVVIPVYNGASHLSDAVDSVLGQTVDTFELIVVDDGSTDRTRDVISHYARTDVRIVAFKQANRGLSAARNSGLRLARADVVAFLDADDSWLPKKLERQMAHLDQHADCEACFTYFEEVDDRLWVTTPWSELEAKYGLSEVSPELLVERGNFVAGSGSSVMARTTAVREAGGFDERLVAAEDLDLWYRLSLRAPLQAVPEVLVKVRRRPGQFQSDRDRILLGRIQFLENVRQEGDRRHAQLARSVEKRLRTLLLSRSLRRGRLLRCGGQALALVSLRRQRGFRG